MKIHKLIKMLADPRIRISTRAEQRLIIIGREALEPLIEAASSASWRVRSRVAWILGSMGDPGAFETILALTCDPHHFVRYEAAWALGMLGDERAIEPLIALARGTDDGGASGSAVNSLVAMGDCALSQIIELAKSENTDDRGIATWALGGSGDERAIAMLSELLSDPDASIREIAIGELQKSGEDHIDQLGQRCLDLIRPCLNDPVNDVVLAAEYCAEALTKALSSTGSARKRPRSHRLRLIVGEKREDRRLHARLIRRIHFHKLRKRNPIRRIAR